MNNKFDLISEYNRLAKVYNLTSQQIKEIYESQFHFTRLAMKEGVHDEPETFKNINFIYLGKLYVKKGVINKMKESNNKRKMKEEKLLEGFSIDPEKEYEFTTCHIPDKYESYIRLGKYLEPNEIQLLKGNYLNEIKNSKFIGDISKEGYNKLKKYMSEITIDKYTTQNELINIVLNKLVGIDMKDRNINLDFSKEDRDKFLHDINDMLFESSNKVTNNKPDYTSYLGPQGIIFNLKNI